VANNPGATILGGFGVTQGSGNASLVAAVDALTPGYAGNAITYDFEPFEVAGRQGSVQERRLAVAQSRRRVAL